ncbi:16S ribosomal RNA methyltransferase RsmE [Streptococcus pneumoniae]|nr:16S ribosomal RNA methyltransferase RsmE [Streptococcus pneumoniae]
MGKKVEKLEKIALGAAEQSKRNIVPSIKLFEKKADFLAQLDQFDFIIVAYEESAKEGEAAALLQAVTGLETGAKETAPLYALSALSVLVELEK